VANLRSNSVSILKNDGNGVFSERIDYDVGSWPNSIFSADLDKDGDLDIAVANASSDNISILKNNGNGVFSERVDYGVGTSPHSVFCADLDGDGDLDIAVVNYIDNTVSILINCFVFTDVKEKNEEVEVPTSFSLGQNFPNPFNSQTAIEYNLPKASYIKIDIYNVLGQKVRTLVDQEENSGHKRVIWDGKNDRGETASSGMYFYRIEAKGGFVQTKKMLFLK
jgi:hypothetical protein